MVKRVRKFLTVILLIIVVMMAFVLAMHYILGWDIWTTDQKGNLSYEVEMLTETYPTDIIVYGNDINFEEGIPSRKAEELSVDKVYNDSQEYFYRVLIINDLEDEISFDESDWEIIDQCVAKGCNLFYFGTQYLETIHDRYNCMIDINETDMFIGIVHEFTGETIGLYGVWDTQTHEKYGTTNFATDIVNVIINEIRDYARQM